MLADAFFHPHQLFQQTSRAAQAVGKERSLVRPPVVTVPGDQVPTARPAPIRSPGKQGGKVTLFLSGNFKLLQNYYAAGGCLLGFELFIYI